MKSAIGANPIKKMLCLWDRTTTNCWPLSDCAVFCKWIFLLLQCLRCWVKKKKIFCSYEIWSQFCWQSGNRRRRQCLSRFDDIDQFSFSVEDIMTFEGFSCFGEGRPDCGFQVWSYLVIIEFSIFFFVSDMVTHESSVNFYKFTGFNSADYNLLVDLIFCSWKEISALSMEGRRAGGFCFLLLTRPLPKGLHDLPALPLWGRQALRHPAYLPDSSGTHSPGRVLEQDVPSDTSLQCLLVILTARWLDVILVFKWILLIALSFYCDNNRIALVLSLGKLLQVFFPKHLLNSLGNCLLGDCFHFLCPHLLRSP